MGGDVFYGYPSQRFDELAMKDTCSPNFRDGVANSASSTINAEFALNPLPGLAVHKNIFQSGPIS
jgi:hypothetical protein